ncbi:MAG: GNAT family N-acetyltransferase [Bacilli bacterium]|jgi:RimJ/RimL family protein N-acetyltransferase
MNAPRWRLATNADQDSILKVIAEARAFLATQGSGQWQDGHPRPEAIAKDIENGRYYVIEVDGMVIGGLALLDYEPDYEELLEGHWRQPGAYLVIHRMALGASHRGQGYGRFALEQVEAIARSLRVGSIRVDTHEKNRPMIALLQKMDYQKIGVVLLNNFKRRLAFEKIV